MATYKILRKNGIFKGFAGDEIITEPGPLLDAAVRSGIVQRVDVHKAEKPKVSRGKGKDS